MNNLWEEFTITQNRAGFPIPICGLCNNSRHIRLVADIKGKQDVRPCICPNGRVTKRSWDRKARKTGVL